MTSKLDQMRRYLSFHKLFLLKIAYVCLAFFITSCFVIENQLTELKFRAQKNLSHVEDRIDYEISNTNHIIYSLASTLLHDFQLKDYNRIQEIIDIFDPQLKHPEFPPFSGYKVLGVNNEVVAISIKSLRPSLKNTIENDPSYLSYIDNVKKEPFKLHIAPIRFSKERPTIEIIPMGMSIVNDEKQYVGIILVGLLTDNLTKKLKKQFPFLKNIKLHNLSDKKNFNNNTIDSIFTFGKLMEHLIKNEPIIVFHSLVDYPFFIEVEIDSIRIDKTIVKATLFCLGYFLLFLIFAYYLWYANCKLYSQSLKTIKSKFDELPNIQNNMNKIFNVDLDSKITPKDLANIISNIIDTYHDCYLEHESNKVEQPANEIKNKILQLILTEKHYYPASRKCHSHFISDLYINQLKIFINENHKTYYLSEFLKEVVSYCSEYYHELNIFLAPVENDKEFSFQHVTLCETIFNIFALILRVGQFDTDKEQVILSGFFNNSNANFPTITIESSITDSDIRSLGWDSGVPYIYSSLFTIYMLAKENNLSFYIEQVEQKIYFIIEPISEERFKSAENCVLKYIKNNGLTADKIPLS